MTKLSRALLTGLAMVVALTTVAVAMGGVFNDTEGEPTGLPPTETGTPTETDTDETEIHDNHDGDIDDEANPVSSDPLDGATPGDMMAPAGENTAPIATMGLLDRLPGTFTDRFTVHSIKLAHGSRELTDGSEIVAGSYLTLTVRWEITDSDFGDLMAGDTLVLDLDPGSVLYFSNTAILSPVDGENGEVWGTFGIRDGNIVFILSEAAVTHNALQNGVFTFSGGTYAVDSDEDCTLTIGDQHAITIRVTPYIYEIPDVDFPYGNPLKKPFYDKSGSDLGGGVIRWRIDMGYDTMLAKLKGDDDEVMYNVLFEDHAIGDQTFSPYSIVVSSRIYRPMDADGSPSATLAGSYSIVTRQLTQQSGESNEDFRQRIIDEPGYIGGSYITVGVTSDGKHVYINFGQVPYVYRTYATGDSLIDRVGNKTLTEAEKAALISLYGGKPITALSVQITATADTLDATYENEATLTYYDGTTERSVTSDRITVRVESQSGSATPLTKDDMRLTKTDAESGEPIKGAGFKLQQLVGGDYADTGLAGETNGSGELEFRDLDKGDYRIVETAAAEGYDPDSAVYSPGAEFSIPGGDKGTLIEVTNAPTTPLPQPGASAVALVKTDSITGKAIEGAGFKLQRLVGETYEDTGYEDITDIEGKLTFDNLEAGDYRLVETAAAEGYDPNSAVYSPGSTFIITDAGETVAIGATNTRTSSGGSGGGNPDPEPKLGSLILTKTDAEDGEPIEGARFKLQRLVGDTYEDTGLTGETDSTGVLVFSNLRAGDYRLVETSAAEGYDLHSAVYSPGHAFIITDAGETVAIGATNTRTSGGGSGGGNPDPEPKAGSLTLTKTDAEDGEPIGGARFKLQRLVGDTYEDAGLTGETDSTGVLVFSNLRAGDYRLVETSAAEGYDPHSAVYSPGSSFAITDAGEAVAIGATNTQTKDTTDPDPEPGPGPTPSRPDRTRPPTSGGGGDSSPAPDTMLPVAPPSAEPPAGIEPEDPRITNPEPDKAIPDTGAARGASMSTFFAVSIGLLALAVHKFKGRSK